MTFITEQVQIAWLLKHPADRIGLRKNMRTIELELNSSYYIMRKILDVATKARISFSSH